MGELGRDWLRGVGGTTKLGFVGHARVSLGSTVEPFMVEEGCLRERG